MKKVIKVVALALASGLAVAGLAFTGCKDNANGDLTVYMPDGAPALAMAKLMAEDTKEDGFIYRVVDPTLITSKIKGDEDKTADFCVLPVTAGAKLLGSGEKYQMLGVVTHGNIFLIAKNSVSYTSENLSDLIGKTVGVLQINAVPGLTFKAVLNKYDVAWQEVGNTDEKAQDKVNLVPITDGGAVGVIQADCFVLAEPAVSAQKGKGYSIVGDLQNLYGGENGYPQAILVGKKSVVADQEKTVAFVEKVKEASTWLTTATGAEIVECVSAHMEDSGRATTLKAPLLTSEVLSRCSVRFSYAWESKTETAEFLNAMLAVNESVTAIPSENFYWNYVKE